MPTALIKKTSFFKIVTFLLYILLGYWGIGIYLIQTQLNYFLFPEVKLTDKTHEISRSEYLDKFGNGLLVREYGVTNEHCLFFFPGQHAGISYYENTLFETFVEHGFHVLSFSYSGQDSAKGRVNNIDVLVSLIKTAITTKLIDCQPEKTLLYGRSLGAMLSVYAIDDEQVSGIILEGAAISLSAGLENYFRRRWYLNLLNYLPLTVLLNQNYQLSHAIAKLPNTPVVIFQGSNDEQTPLNDLLPLEDQFSNLSLYEINHANHSNTLEKGLTEIIDYATTMLD